MNTPVVDFIHELNWQSVPDAARRSTRRALLDLLGVAAAGTQTYVSRIIRDHAASEFAAGGSGARMLFDARCCSAVGAALAGGMMIDSVDAHDGHKLVKGHVGCGVLPAVLAMADAWRALDEQEFMSALLVGYEMGTRAGMALHRSASDYHSSGAWVSLAAAAVAARSLQLNAQTTWEALGVAEYHGPRSQMMRCVDHPTMVKDGSGWGAMAGVSAALLARQGFTGAPAVSVGAEEQADLWNDFGSTWRITEQYHKLYPVCRWAQPGIRAALALREQHTFSVLDIKSVRVGTFHESWRLATRAPRTTDEAQYSLSFPIAAALVHGEVGVEQIAGDGLLDEAVLSLSSGMQLVEVPEYNNAFPLKRISDITIELQDGQRLGSGPTEAAGDPEMPLDDAEITAKFRQLAIPVLGESRALAIEAVVGRMGENNSTNVLDSLLYEPAFDGTVANPEIESSLQ